MDGNLNDTDFNGSADENPFAQPYWRWNVITAICIGIVGLVANTALLLIILLNRHLRTTSNILVGNLALADIMMFVFNVPLTTMAWMFIGWPAGRLGVALCKFGGFGLTLGQVLCATSLTAVSIERFFSLRRRVQVKRTLAILVGVWVIGLCFAIPVLFMVHTIDVMEIDTHFCVLLPQSERAIRAYVTAYACLTYFLPVLIIAGCYVGMARVLFGKAEGESVQSVRARRRLAVVVLCLAVAFVIFWFPYHFINMFFLYSKWETQSSIHISVYERLIEIAHVVILANSCLNPFVVFLISNVHRKPLLDFLTCNWFRKSAAQAVDGHYAPVPDSVYAETTIAQ